jgi:SET domain-containing protein
MPQKQFRVGRSRTGLGLFATDFIKKGKFIVEYTGRRVTSAESEKLENKGARYMYELNSKWAIDGSSRSNLGRYANHSCRPNAESDVIRGKKVIIRAIRNIKPGEEITYDYGRDYFRNVLMEIGGCKCVKCLEKAREERRAKRLRNLRKKARAQKAKANGARAGKTRKKRKSARR